MDPDTHIDSIEQAEGAVLEGTANWSAKIAVTGRHNQIHDLTEIGVISRQFQYTNRFILSSFPSD